MNTKYCSKCKNEVLISEFRRHTGKKANKDGLYSFCKACEAAYMKEYMKKYRQTTRKQPRQRLNHNISKAMQRALKGKKAFIHWENLVGYTVADLIAHIEKQFQPGMTWANYGKWHIDHIRPQASFSYDGPSHPDFLVCWGLQNLQPLWAADNSRKKDKYPYLP